MGAALINEQTRRVVCLVSLSASLSVFFLRFPKKLSRIYFSTPGGGGGGGIGGRSSGVPVCSSIV